MRAGYCYATIMKRAYTGSYSGLCVNVGSKKGLLGFDNQGFCNPRARYACCELPLGSEALQNRGQWWLEKSRTGNERFGPRGTSGPSAITGLTPTKLFLVLYLHLLRSMSLFFLSRTREPHLVVRTEALFE